MSRCRKKTENMVISKKKITATYDIVVNWTVLKTVRKLNYLGSLIAAGGRCNSFQECG